MHPIFTTSNQPLPPPLGFTSPKKFSPRDNLNRPSLSQLIQQEKKSNAALLLKSTSPYGSSGSQLKPIKKPLNTSP